MLMVALIRQQKLILLQSKKDYPQESSRSSKDGLFFFTEFSTGKKLETTAYLSITERS